MYVWLSLKYDTVGLAFAYPCVYLAQIMLKQIH